MTRLPANKAGYMELSGAQKDADCMKVEVKNGVSTKLGCCNEFDPKNDKVQNFRCGDCEYVKRRGVGALLGRMAKQP